jgi:hypothetical protein
MSEQQIEQPTIEAPISSPEARTPAGKRKYTRKPKPVVEPGSSRSQLATIIDIKPEPGSSRSQLATIIDVKPEPVEQVVVEKPKRKYTRKPKVIVESEPESVSSTEIVTSESEPEQQPPPIKKERTQKQKDAFNRMREARIKKSEELASLKEFKKEKDLLEKENAKVHKMEQKIVKKSQPKPRKQKEETYYSDPEQHSNIKVSTHKPIMFV